MRVLKKSNQMWFKLGIWSHFSLNKTFLVKNPILPLRNQKLSLRLLAGLNFLGGHLEALS